MIVEKLIGNIQDYNIQSEVIYVIFEWFEIEKKRIAKVAPDGTEIGVCVGHTLKEGDILGKKEGKIYVVSVAPSHLIKISVSTMQEMGRLCFELGNRHLSLKIEDNAVLIPFDQPTFEYLIKLGFDVSEVEGAFTDFIECKAHGASENAISNKHSHGHHHHHHG